MNGTAGSAYEFSSHIEPSSQPLHLVRVDIEGRFAPKTQARRFCRGHARHHTLKAYRHDLSHFLNILPGPAAESRISFVDRNIVQSWLRNNKDKRLYCASFYVLIASIIRSEH